MDDEIKLSFDSPEIDEGKNYTGYNEALNLIRTGIGPVGAEERSLELCAGYVVAESVVSSINNPSQDVSLKDGYAVKSKDVAGAVFKHPVVLPVIGHAFAGACFEGTVPKGSAVRITSGSPIPTGADAVVAGEFCQEIDSRVIIKASAEPGRNIMRAGQDIKAGSVIAEKGKILLPADLGLIAAAGISRIKVYRRPRVAVIAIGDEVVAPGSRLEPGQLYASNMFTIGGWLASYGIRYDNAIVTDSREAIKQRLTGFLPVVDAILTSGGAWGSERDLVVGVMDELGWDKKFHHIRMGPGKGIAFGLWEDKPVFCLPGGPASNEMAFIQLALPGVLRLAGHESHPLQTVPARLIEDVKGRHRDWTEFRDATLYRDSGGNYVVKLYRGRSRLQAIAGANCLLCIPEGKEGLDSGDMVMVQLLMPSFAALPLEDKRLESKE